MSHLILTTPNIPLHPRSVQRANGLPVDVVAHHGKARRQRHAFEVLCKSQGGIVLRNRGAEGAEFCEGEIEGHKVTLSRITDIGIW